MEGTRAVRVVRGLASLILSIGLAWTRILSFLEGCRHLPVFGPCAGQICSLQMAILAMLRLCRSHVLSMIWPCHNTVLAVLVMFPPCAIHAVANYAFVCPRLHVRIRTHARPPVATGVVPNPRCAQAGLVPCPSTQRASGHPMDIQNEVEAEIHV